MKSHSCWLIFLLSFYYFNAARGQTITLSVKNSSFEKVILLIEQQSNFHFIYTSEQLAASNPVTLSLNKVTLTTALDKCFEGQPLQYTIRDKSITIHEKKIAEAGRTLKGRVIDQEGHPMKAVTLSFRNTNLVQVSDEQGEFTFLNPPPGGTLLASSVQIEPLEQVVGDATYIVLHVTIKVGLLDETMVIAYGKTSRRYSTGSVSSVKASEISTQPAANVLTVLAGRVPGLQVSQVSGAPGSFIRLQIRGQNSIANGKDPLIIIDGVPFPAQPLNGAFGGGAGSAASPLNAISPSDIASVEVLKDADATAIYGSRGANGVILITTKKATDGGLHTTLRLLQGAGNITRRMDLMKTPDYLAMRHEAFANDGITPNASNARDLLLWDTTRYTDWQKELMGHNMSNTDANLSIAGGNQQVQFLVNAAWHKQTSVYPGNFNEDRKTASLNVGYAPATSRFKINITTSFSRYDNILPQVDFFNNITLSPNAPAIYNSDGSLNWENSTWVNPLSKQYATFTNGTDNLNSNIDLSYAILPSLKFRLTGGYSSLWSKDLTQTPQASLNPSRGTPSSAGFGSKTLATWIAEPQLEFAKHFGKGEFSVLTGLTLQQSRQKELYQSATGYTTDALLQSIRGAGQVTIAGENDILYRYSGLFARIRYDYDKKYLITLTARRDGSSRYGDQDRFANFGSAGLAWIFSNESFMKNWKFLSFGKIKGSIGTTGNDQIGDYKYLRLYTPGSYSYLGVTPFYPSQHYNPQYSWEKLRKIEGGLDLGFLEDRILFSVNYYYNTTSNQLVSYPLPAMTGFNGILRNIPAVIQNTGWEFELNARVIANKTFVWNTSLNLTIPRNKLVSFDNLAKSSYVTLYAVGQPLSIVKTLAYTGINSTTGVYTFQDYDKNGSIGLPQDQQQILFTGQQYYGGWQNSFTFGKFSASILFQFVRQKHAPNYVSKLGQPGIMGNQPVFLTDRWRKPGDNATYQQYTYAGASASTAFYYYTLSDAAYTDASYIRLRNISVSYDLFKSVKAGKISKGTIFLEGYNLVTITNYQGFDPENLSQAVPPVRMLAAGFQLTF